MKASKPVAGFFNVSPFYIAGMASIDQITVLSTLYFGITHLLTRVILDRYFTK
ncbi:hypothetical protein P20652_3672 [Pseudoalteromonas sp. BSi20652]|nr:hypothetical protein P20652_3672 [Pseudoalteromonas sp. BSi20652]